MVAIIFLCKHTAVWPWGGWNREVLHESKILTTKQLPETERPYEKCEQLGVQSLTNAELLAAILQSGTQKSGPGSGLPSAERRR